MKNDINIPIPKEEDIIALDKRRLSYAASRDLQAAEFNDAIIKRSQSEALNNIKCDKCGKEFSARESADPILTCPDCLGKSE